MNGGKMKLAKTKKHLWYFCFVFFLFQAAAFLSGCGAKNPALTSAKIYLGLVPPDYDKAAEQLKLALDHDSTSAQAHFLLGKIYSQKMMYEEMMEEFWKAERLEMNPKDSVEMSSIRNDKWAESLNSGIDLGKKQRAVGQYKQDLMTDFSRYPTYKDSLRLLAGDLENAGKFSWDSCQKFEEAKPTLEELEQSFGEKTRQMYQTAMLIDSTRHEAYLNLGAVLARTGEKENALELYERAYKLKPDDSRVMTGYAACLISDNKFDQASEIYEKIIQLDPQNVNALFNLAAVNRQKGDNQKAEEAYSKIISIDPEYRDAYFNRGLLRLSKVQDQLSVLVTYKDSLQQNPKDKELPSRYELAKGEYEKSFARAESDFQKCAEIDTTDKEAYFHLGLLYISKAQTYNPILSAYRDTLEKKPKDKQLSDRYTSARDEKNQNLGEAETFFQKASNLAPYDLETLKYLGFILLSQDKWEEASRSLEKVVELAPKDKEAWGYLSIAYARLGKKDKADEALKKSRE
jgi:tetratricopeptide (TPR) repeat protein